MMVSSDDRIGEVGRLLTGRLAGLRHRLMLMLATLCLLSFPLRAEAHTFITITGDLVVDGDELTLTVGINLQDVIATWAPKTTVLTRAELQALLPAIGPYLRARLMLTIDGVASDGFFSGYLPDLLDPASAAAHASEAVPEKLAFVLVWKLPAGADRLVFICNLFAEAGMPGVCHVNLFTPSAKKPQSRYLELGKPGTFSLKSAPVPAPVAPLAPVPSAAAPAIPATSPATSAAEPPPAAQPANESVVWRFLQIGYFHIVPDGIDHILFVLGLFLLSPRLRPLLIQITAFTVAHSISLGLCMAELVTLPSRLVETLIAVSIAVVAVENIFYREVKPWRWLLVFGFGLIHGLGFAGDLKRLEVPAGSFFPALISFNVGVEFGQLTVVAAAIALTVWFWKRPSYHRFVTVPCSALIAVIGLWWAVERAFGLGG